MQPAEEPMPEIIPKMISPILGREQVLAGVSSTVRVLLEVSVPELELAEREPVNLACVLDTSTSMDGSRLWFAKEALKRIIQALSPRDTLHLIAYSEDARVVFADGDLSEENKDALKTQVANLRAGGCTNILAGIEQGAALLEGPGAEPEAEMDPGNVLTSTRRIFLFSDGEVNRGVTSPHEIKARVASLASKGITTTAFGIGDSFDELLMKGIAEEGKGQYVYLSTEPEIKTRVKKALNGVLDLYGTEAKLEVRGLKHTTAQIFQGDEKNSDNPGTLLLGDIYRGGDRKILVQLAVAPPGDAEGEFECLMWALSFRQQHKVVNLSGRLCLNIVEHTALVGDEHIAVQAAFVIQHDVVQQQREVDELLAQGHRRQAGKVLKDLVSMLEAKLQQFHWHGADPIDLRTLEDVKSRWNRIVAEFQDEDATDERLRRSCRYSMHLSTRMDTLSLAQSPAATPVNSPRGHQAFAWDTPDFACESPRSLKSSPRVLEALSSFDPDRPRRGSATTVGNRSIHNTLACFQGCISMLCRNRHEQILR